jgi:hypothetical protein
MGEPGLSFLLIMAGLETNFMEIQGKLLALAVGIFGLSPDSSARWRIVIPNSCKTS